MSDTNKENVNLDIQSTLDRIKELKNLRETAETKKHEVEVHEKDLKAIESVKGVDNDDYRVKKEVLDITKGELAEAETKIENLSFKQSELKPIFDEVAKKFETELRSEQEREFHVEIGPSVYVVDKETGERKQNEDGTYVINPVNQKAGRHAFKHLLEYLNRDVKWTAKTAPGLLVLVRNMEENKGWARDVEFDNIIKLRSSNVLVLWRSVLEDMEGRGFYEAKSFLECWANCGKGISEAVREIQKLHENVRQLGTDLNTIEDEYLRSERDIEQEEGLSIQEEVAPEV